jgi:hypothetical protein
MMKSTGAVDTGIQQTTQGELEIRAGSSTVAKADSNGILSDVGIIRHKNIISTEISIATDETACVGGPITISSTGGITVNGNGIMVII